MLDISKQTKLQQILSVDDSATARNAALLACNPPKFRQTKRRSSEPSKRRSISFAPVDDIFFVPTLNDMSLKEIQDVWYNEHEVKMHRKAFKKILKKMMLGIYEHDDHCPESETRGLETKTPIGSDDRQINREVALFAVLDEQEKQRYYRTYDPARIAKVYKKKSFGCQAQAILMAAMDAQVVRDMIDIDRPTNCEHCQYNKELREAAFNSDNESVYAASESSDSSEAHSLPPTDSRIPKDNEEIKQKIRPRRWSLSTFTNNLASRSRRRVGVCK